MPVSVGTPIGSSVTVSSPSYSVQCGFAADPFDALSSVDWTEIATGGSSGSIMGINIRRGRQHELSRFETGTCSIELNNSGAFAGRYTPSNTGSPHYPNMKPDIRIRVLVTWDGIPYSLFTGYVETWGLDWTQKNYSTVRISCVDVFKKLATANVYGSPYETIVRIDAPKAWWRLGETGDAIVAGDSSLTGAFAGQYQGSPTLSVGTSQGYGLAAGDRDTGMQCAHVSNQRMLAPTAALTGFPFAFECLIKTDQNRPSLKMILAGYEGPAAPIGEFLNVCVLDNNYGANAGKAALIVQTSLGQTFVHTNSTVDDGTVKHLMVEMDSASVGRIYVNGSLSNTTTASAAGRFPRITSGWSIGNSPAVNWGSYGFEGIIDEPAIYDHTFAVLRIIMHSDAAVGQWAQHSSGDRIFWTLGFLGIEPSGDLSDLLDDLIQDEGKSDNLQSVTNNGSMLSYLQLVEATEGGALFVRADGKLIFQDRYKHLFAPYTVSQGTFGQESGDLPNSPPFEFSKDDSDLWNEAHVTRHDGKPQIAVDFASRAAYGPRVYPEISNTLHATDNEALDRGYWITSNYSQRVDRIRTLTLNPFANAAGLYPQIFGRELRDRITVHARPPGSTLLTQASHIEHIEHDIRPSSFRTTWQLSAADLTKYAFFDSCTFDNCVMTY